MDLPGSSLKTAVRQLFQAESQYRELEQQLVQLCQQDDGLKTEQGKKTMRQWTKVRDQGLLLLDQVTAFCLSPWDLAEVKAVLIRQGSEVDDQQSTMDAQHKAQKPMAGASQAPLLRASARLRHLGRRERPENGSLSQGERESLS